MSTINCTLCRALRDEEYRIVYEDALVFVMINNSPLKNGHVIILPVRHAEQLEDLQPDEAQAILQCTNRCMRAVEAMTGETSVAVVNGWAYRSEPHLHVHVLPSKENLRGLFVASESVERRMIADKSTLEKMAQEFTNNFI